MSFLRRLAGGWREGDHTDMSLTNVEGRGGIEVSTPTQLEGVNVEEYFEAGLSGIPTPGRTPEPREQVARGREAQGGSEGDYGVEYSSQVEVMTPDLQEGEGSEEEEIQGYQEQGSMLAERRIPQGVAQAAGDSQDFLELEQGNVIPGRGRVRVTSSKVLYIRPAERVGRQRAAWDGASQYYTPGTGSSQYYTPGIGSSQYYTPGTGSSQYHTGQNPGTGSPQYYTPETGTSQYHTGQNPGTGSSQYYTPETGTSQYHTGQNPGNGSSQYYTDYAPGAGSSQNFTGYNPGAGVLQEGALRNNTGQFTPELELSKTAAFQQPDVAGYSPEPLRFNLEACQEAEVGPRRGFEQTVYRNSPPPTYQSYLGVPGTGRVTRARPRQEDKSHGRIGGHKMILPDKFDGKTDWEEFITHFTTVAAWNGWSDEEQAIQLGLSMSGRARSIFTGLPMMVKQDYPLLISYMAKHFGPAGREAAYKAEFRQ